MPEIAYSKLRPKELLKLYNERARELGEPELNRALPHVRMAQELALIMTRRKPKEAPAAPVAEADEAGVILPTKRQARKQPIRDAVVAALSEVAYYETPDGTKIKPDAARRYNKKGLISVGFSYAVCLKKVKRRFRKSKVSSTTLRVAATNIAAAVPGFEHGQLPNKRPRSTEGV